MTPSSHHHSAPTTSRCDHSSTDDTPAQTCAHITLSTGIFYMARKFYCLFQQHSTPERIHQDNQVFGEYGWNWVGCLGTSTAVLVMDTRTERSREFVVRPASWVMIQQQLAALPSSIKHVVVVATVPFIYPKIAIVEASLGFLTGQGRMAQSVNAFMQKTGLASMIANSFGEIEVLDDLLDHWSANVHAHEKLAVLHMLQDMAQVRHNVLGSGFHNLSSHDLVT